MRRVLVATSIAAALSASALSVPVSQSGDTPSLPTQEFRDHRCVERPPLSRILSFGACYGSFPAPTDSPSSATAETEEAQVSTGFCVGSCVRGINVVPFRECEPHMGSTCRAQIATVKIVVTEKAECIVYRERSCICVLYVPVRPDEQVEDEIPIVNGCGG